MKDLMGYEVVDYEKQDKAMVDRTYNILLDLYNYLFDYEEVEDLKQEDYEKILRDVSLAIDYLEGYGG